MLIRKSAVNKTKSKEGITIPRGAESFLKSTETAKARRTQPSAFVRADDMFKLNDGEIARVRFLEQGDDLAWAITHRIKIPAAKWPVDFLCLDQMENGTPCPACQSSDTDNRKRSKKGYLNIIWRGSVEDQSQKYKLAPIYKRQENGAVEKENGNPIITELADSVWLWKCSKTVFELLLDKDTKYKGLMSRDLVVTRQGAGLEDTKYFIEPADIDAGPEPMTIADNNLAKEKYNIDALTTPESFEELAAKLNGQPTVSGPQPTFSRDLPTGESDIFNGGPPARSSAFQR